MVKIGSRIKVNNRIGKIIDISQLKNDSRYVITYIDNNGEYKTFIEGNIKYKVIKRKWEKWIENWIER